MFPNIWQLPLSDFCDSKFLEPCIAKQNMESSNCSCWTAPPLKQELPRAHKWALVHYNIKALPFVIPESKLLTESKGKVQLQSIAALGWGWSAPACPIAMSHHFAVASCSTLSF